MRTSERFAGRCSTSVFRSIRPLSMRRPSLCPDMSSASTERKDPTKRIATISSSLRSYKRSWNSRTGSFCRSERSGIRLSIDRPTLFARLHVEPVAEIPGHFASLQLLLEMHQFSARVLQQKLPRYPEEQHKQIHRQQRQVDHDRLPIFGEQVVLIRQQEVELHNRGQDECDQHRSR